jgi:hypothetical protein
METDADREATIVKQRRSIAVAWAVTAGLIALTAITAHPQLILTTWLVVLVVLLLTARRNHAEREERLERPHAYRAIAGAVVGVALAGSVFSLLPSVADTTQLSLPFFAGTALLAYRALVARGPRPTLLLVSLASFGWIWGALVFAVGGHKCGGRHHHHTQDWTDAAARSIFLVELVLIAVLVAITLVSFRRRTDALPDARVV